MSKCTKKVAGIYAGCYKKTGSVCLPDDAKLAKTLASIPKSVGKKCNTAAVIADAGYGPYTVPKFSSFIPDACKWQARLISERSFGVDGSLYAAADSDGQKCLLNAAKTAAKFLSGALKDVSKCVATGCSFDFTADAADAVLGVDKKCADFLAVGGTTTAAYVAAASAQVRRSLASPCDPMDTDSCAFPFPNDYFSVGGASTPSGRRVALGDATIVGAVNGKTVTTDAWNEADGFSVGPMFLLNNVDIDLAMTGATPITDLVQSLSPTAPVVLIDAITGEKQLLWLERDLNGATLDDRPIIGRVGRNLKEGRRYIVAMRNMKDSGGVVLPPEPGFAIYRDNTPTTILPIEARRPHMEDIFATLIGHGIPRGDLYLAWDFTTQSADSVSRRHLAIRDDAFATLGAASPAFTVDSVTDPMDGKIFRQVDGTFQVPLYLNTGGVPGSTLRTDAYGVPYTTGDFYTAAYRCMIPLAATTGGAAPAVPARVSLYGHGLLGRYTQVSGGHVRDFSNEHNVVFCATDWTGFEEADEEYVLLSILPDFSNFPNFIDRQHQGILNFQFLGRLMINAAGFASDPAFQIAGDSLLDGSDLFYDGNSQGGILGGVLAAVSQDATRFSLGVPGMNYSTLLDRSVDFIGFNSVLSNFYPKSTERNLLLSASQLLWDRTDPSGHVNHTVADPYANTPAKTLLYQVAFGDHQVAPVTAEIAARSNGATIHAPTLDPGKSVPEVTPYYDIPATSYPSSGSALVIWDSGNPAPPIGNVPPEVITPMDIEWGDLEACAQAGDSDPHSCPRNSVAARLQKSEFLKTGGMVIDVCAGAPCVAP